MPNNTNSAQYRAYCKTCGKKYSWKATRNEAVDDANSHHNSRPTHTVLIEKKTVRLQFKALSFR